MIYYIHQQKNPTKAITINAAKQIAIIQAQTNNMKRTIFMPLKYKKKETHKKKKNKITKSL